jgi:iron complex outermembrane receptor protein
MLTYEPGSAKWNLQAYVRNFTDEVVFSRIAQNNVVHVQEYQFAPPRTYGLRFQYNF